MTIIGALALGLVLCFALTVIAAAVFIVGSQRDDDLAR